LSIFIGFYKLLCSPSIAEGFAQVTVLFARGHFARPSHHIGDTEEKTEMSVDHFPGEFRVGVLNEAASGVSDGTPDMLTPKFLVLILLRGEQRFYLDGELIELKANREDDRAPVGFAVLLKERCELRFAGSWGNPFRKISIAGPPDWFNLVAQDIAPASEFPHFPKQHREHRIWSPGQDTVRLTNQIIHAPPEESGQQLGLFRMSRALEILRRIPDEMANALNRPVSTDAVKLERLRLYILDNLETDLTLPSLEAEFGLNRRSLQRRFKQEYGVGLSDFVRVSRLNKVNLRLQNGDLTVSEAAYLAGYSSTANFTTAFRKQFGATPARVRNQTI